MTRASQLIVLAGVLALAICHPCPAQRQSSPFDQWDRNGDGKLVRDELPERLRGNFDRVDTNDDGVISREEDAAFRRRGARRPAENRAPNGVRLTRDVPYAGTDNPRQI